MAVKIFSSRYETENKANKEEKTKEEKVVEFIAFSRAQSGDMLLVYEALLTVRSSFHGLIYQDRFIQGPPIIKPLNKEHSALSMSHTTFDLCTLLAHGVVSKMARN